MIHFGDGIFGRLRFQSFGKLRYGEPCFAAHNVLFQGVVHKFVLIHIFDKAFSALANFLQIAEHMETVLFFGKLQVGIDCHVNAWSATAITEKEKQICYY